MEKTEFEQMRDKALEQLMKGQSLTGKDGGVCSVASTIFGKCSRVRNECSSQ